MSKQIVIAEQHRIAAVFAEDQIQELIVATGSHQVGDIYLGIVENVLPGIDAAFVNIGDSERNGFIHVSDLGPVRLKRSAGAITELLTPQQKVLIQVMKEPTGNKGPRLTGNISLPGRYLVLMPFGRGVNLSRRIRNENERNRLRALGILIKPAGMGLLLRTEAENVSEDLIIEDLENLQKQWEAIQQQASSTRAPALLGRDEDFIQRVLRDVYSADVNRIVVDSVTGLKRVKQQLINWNAGGKLPTGVLIDHHREPAPILEYFRVNAAIREALKPRVDLPSGGYIVIERTEALTVIDVNSGSFTRSATARETVLWTNSEAATEIARQLRLRNIAGVIIVDFIDMDSRRDQLQVLEQFNKALKADKARPQIAQLTELGLVELTRKRQGQNIYELFGRACATCGGLGHLVHLPGDPRDAAGESLERTVASRSIDPGPRLRVAEPAEPRDEFSAEFGEPGQDLELVNHPNYQERGNRRRRRPGRGESAAGNSRVNSRIVTVPGGGAVLSVPATPAGNGGHSSLNPIIDEPALTEKTEIGERQRPNRRQLSKNRPIAEPPELVSVVMTAEEQQVYAAMGISPLVLYSGEVKNPRSAVISVALPGQTPVPPPPPMVRSNGNREESTAEEGTAPDFRAEPSTGEPDRFESVPLGSGLSESDRAKTGNLNPSLPTVAPSQDTDGSILDAYLAGTGIETEAESGGDNSSRRRRRRSSASATGQLSLET